MKICTEKWKIVIKKLFITYQQKLSLVYFANDDLKQCQNNTGEHYVASKVFTQDM